MSEKLPFEHHVNVRTLPKKGREETREASEKEREAVARHLGLEAVSHAKFTADVLPWKRDGIRIAGHLAVDLVQACVVSLEPVAETVDEPFEALLVPEGSRLASPDPATAEMVLNAEGDDAPETFEGDTIDLAAVWLEFLALAIEPFPRAAGAELAVDDTDEKPSPFAALAALKAANDT